MERRDIFKTLPHSPLIGGVMYFLHLDIVFKMDIADMHACIFIFDRQKKKKNRRNGPTFSFLVCY